MLQLLAVAGWPAHAQELIYRCGQEYTNAPQDASRCERLPPQSVTVIPGLKPARVQPPVVQQAPATASALGASATAPGAQTVNGPVTDAPQRQRDQQARTIVATELEKTRQRHAELVREYQQGAPTKTASDEANPRQYPERVAQLKAAIERHERDIDSLQRELARRPAP